MKINPPKISNKLPVVAIVGRPNVGKSTLVNRLCGSRQAVTDSYAGVTRDRKVFTTEWNGRLFDLVDTGGWIESSTDTLEGKVSLQSEIAAVESDLVVFVVDGLVGATEEDRAAITMLRKKNRKIILVVNKIDSAQQEPRGWEAASLGISELYMTSALHGRSTGDLLDAIVSQLPGDSHGSTPELEDNGILASVAIVGRPNVGKSTLFNRMVGEDRSIVHDEPGTTRDSIDTLVETDFGTLKFIDTAGLRRRAKEAIGAEYYSLVRAFDSIDRSDVVLMLIDSSEGITHQDQRLVERIDVSGSPIVIILNKWETLSNEARVELEAEVRDRMGFIAYAPILKVSALSGLGVHKVLPAINQSIAAYRRRIPTSQVNTIVKQAIAHHSPPAGTSIKYATQGAIDPPTFIIFANRELQRTYLRYLENFLRDKLELGPTPLKIRVKK